MKIKALLFFTLAFFATSGYAKSLDVSLYLNKIQARIQNEKKNDEIYFSIIEYTSAHNASKYYTMPYSSHKHRHFSSPHTSNTGHPIFHWNSSDFHKLNNIRIWSQKLAPGQGVELYLSVVEHDTPPWDLDDSIGAIKIKLLNRQGKLLSRWSYLGGAQAGNQHVTSNDAIKMHHYVFSGSGAKYHISFYLNSVKKGDKE